MLENIYLIDRSGDLVDEWKKEFSRYPNVLPLVADYFSQNADAMVSPANSFGIMDGGLDDLIRDRLGDPVESKVQARIVKDFYGELPVGSALLVRTNHKDWPYLICAPTMRVPEDISHTVNAYLAFRSVLVSVMRHNAKNMDSTINSLVCSGFGTGVGGMKPDQCAVQMRVAYESILAGGSIPKIREIHRTHRLLKGD